MASDSSVHAPSGPCCWRLTTRTRRYVAVSLCVCLFVIPWPALQQAPDAWAQVRESVMRALTGMGVAVIVDSMRGKPAGQIQSVLHSIRETLSSPYPRSSDFEDFLASLDGALSSVVPGTPPLRFDPCFSVHTHTHSLSLSLLCPRCSLSAPHL
jgi:hypothetical protein